MCSWGKFSLGNNVINKKLTAVKILSLKLFIINSRFYIHEQNFFFKKSIYTKKLYAIIINIFNYLRRSLLNIYKFKENNKSNK